MIICVDYRDLVNPTIPEPRRGKENSVFKHCYCQFVVGPWINAIRILFGNGEAYSGFLEGHAWCLIPCSHRTKSVNAESAS